MAIYMATPRPGKVLRRNTEALRRMGFRVLGSPGLIGTSV
jgi:hypothetical protein